jgi:transmembrane sensor
MEQPMEDRIWDEAATWCIALKQDDCDWDGFTTWLETGPRHREVFEEIALLDDKIMRARTELAKHFPAEIPDAHVVSPQRRRWIALALGVAAIAAVGITLPMLSNDDSEILYQTGIGQSRLIGLGDGSHIQLASASRLSIWKNERREMTLDGAAVFDIRHDPSRKLILHAGRFDIADIGTRFEVATNDGNLYVAVAEGSLSINGRDLAHPVKLGRGQRFIVAQGFGVGEKGTVDPGDVGSWQSGRLVYQNAPLSLVVADINRYAPTKLFADPKIVGQRFSGVLTIGDGSELAENLQQFMGLSSRREGDHIRLLDSRSR